MGMAIDEIIKKENEIAAEFQKTVDTHIVNDNGDTIEEMYCDDTEVIEEHLQRYKVIADYHSTIANTLCKYQTMQEVLEKVWKVPSCIIDKEDCLNKIMETYRTVR